MYSLLDVAGLADRFTSDVNGVWPESGTISPDGVAIIGHAGFAFLHGGGNNYYRAYSPSHDDALLAEAWAHYIEASRESLAEIGVDFAFSLVPNKATVMPQHYPRELGGQITSRAALLLRHLEKKDCLLFDAFCKAPMPESLFRRNDSHLTDLGNFLLADAILSLAKSNPDWSHYDMVNVKQIHHAGDLGSRFDPKAMEVLYRCHHPVSTAKIMDRSYCELKGKFVGSGFQSINPNAPIRKKILIFGNSFIERVPSWGAAMPLAATVTDIRFVWYPGVDVALAREWQPDLVVFQTCERFLSRKPEAT